MGGGKGDSGGSGTYDYFGSIIGAVCAGPVDSLLAIIIDGKEAWPAAAAFKTGVAYAVNNLVNHLGRTWKCISTIGTSSTVNAPPNATYWVEYSLDRDGSNPDFVNVTVTGWGSMRFNWGTATPTLQNKFTAYDSGTNPTGNKAGHSHPPYAHCATAGFVDFLSGRERTSFPNIEFVVRRKPKQSVVTGNAAGLRDGQCNPVAFMVEILTDPIHGLGLPTSSIDTASFQAVADVLDAIHTKAYISPLLDRQMTAEDAIALISQHADIAIRWDPDLRKLKCVHWDNSSNPYPTLSEELGNVYLIDSPVTNPGSLSQVKTQVHVQFTDRDRAYKSSTDSHRDLRNRTVTGRENSETVSRPWITRREQAKYHALEILKKYSAPMTRVQWSTRREIARPMQLGSWILGPTATFDLSDSSYFKLIGRRITKSEGITLEAEEDPSIGVVSFQSAAITPPTLSQPDTPEIANLRMMVAPVKWSGSGGTKVVILAQRPDNMLTGFVAHVDTETFGTDYQELGAETSWAVRGTLRSSYSDTSTGAVECTFADQVDKTRLAESLTDTEIADRKLLAILIKTASGQIAQDASNYDHVEILNIRSMALVSGNNYDLTVDREQLGTEAHTFGTSDTEVWIVYRDAVTFFGHQGFDTLQQNSEVNEVPDSLFFKLQPFNAFKTRNVDDCTDYEFKFPKRSRGAPSITWNDPTTTPVTYGSAPQTVTFDALAIDEDGDMDSLTLQYRKPDGDYVTVVAKVFGLRSQEPIRQQITFSAGGVYDVILRATDASGLEVQSIRTIEVNYSASKVAIPSIDIPGYSSNPETLTSAQARAATLSCVTSGATIQYQFTASTAPAPGGTWTTYPGSGGGSGSGSRVANFTGYDQGKKLWIKGVKAGLTDSDYRVAIMLA